MNPKSNEILSVLELMQALGQQITVLDLETTGLLRDETVGIVEYAASTLQIDGKPAVIHSGRINPGIPIPHQASRIHGITDEMVGREPQYPSAHDRLMQLFATSVICGFNSNEYDIEVVRRNALRYGLSYQTPAQVLDLREVWVSVSGSKRGNLAAVASHYGAASGVAHSAAGDVETCLRILDAMIQRHGVEMMMRHVRPHASLDTDDSDEKTFSRPRG